MDFSVGQLTYPQKVTVRKTVEASGREAEVEEEAVAVPLLELPKTSQADCDFFRPSSCDMDFSDDEWEILKDTLDVPDELGSSTSAESCRSSNTLIGTIPRAEVIMIYGRYFPWIRWTWHAVDEKHRAAMMRDHEILFRSEGRDLVCAPVHEPRRILDLRAETGIWASQVAEAYSSAEVTGISAVSAPPDMPPNCRIEKRTNDSPCSVHPQSQDLIHGSGLAGTVADWSTLCHRAFVDLRFGGYLQVCERSFQFQGKDGPLDPQHIWSRVATDVHCLGQLLGSPFDVTQAGRLQYFLESAGFVNVFMIQETVPVSGYLDVLLDQVECIMVRKWYWDNLPPIDVENRIDRLRRDLKANVSGVYAQCVRVWGQKPYLSQPFTEEIMALGMDEARHLVDDRFLRQVASEIWSGHDLTAASRYRSMTVNNHPLRSAVEKIIFVHDIQVGLSSPHCSPSRVPDRDQRSPTEVRSRFCLWLQYVGLSLLVPGSQAAEDLLRKDEESLLAPLVHGAPRIERSTACYGDVYHRIALFRLVSEALGVEEDHLQHAIEDDHSAAHNLGLCGAALGIVGSKGIVKVGDPTVATSLCRSKTVAGKGLTEDDMKELVRISIDILGGE